MEISDPKISNSLHNYAFGEQILMKLHMMHISRDAFFKSICLKYVYVATIVLLKKDSKLIYCVFFVHTGLEDRRSSISKVAGL